MSVTCFGFLLLSSTCSKLDGNYQICSGMDSIGKRQILQIARGWQYFLSQQSQSPPKKNAAKLLDSVLALGLSLLGRGVADLSVDFYAQMKDSWTVTCTCTHPPQPLFRNLVSQVWVGRFTWEAFRDFLANSILVADWAALPEHIQMDFPVSQLR